MIKKIALFFSIVLLLTSCSSSQPEKLKISATTWIGYSPLYYAKEKGWLKPLNIKLLHVVSLSENMYLYQSGNSDAYVGTQYEYSILSPQDSSLLPIMMFDRSYGGDIIMSNVSIEALKNTDETIDAYLEMDSINSTLLKDFIKLHGLYEKNINYINQDQANISTLEAKNTKRPSLIITYNPYNIDLEKQGFNEIASTKNGLDLLVVDALFTTEDVLHKHKDQFIQLKKLVSDAVDVLKQNPREFYETVKPYMLEVSYEEFLHSLNDIIWINQSIDPKLKERMREANFPTRGLI
ncbi:ABC transporter substrate-binding protein [Thiomicrorhabdus sp. ZW0627]|uniref:ABC transporter substrate-binding protein n=1 Tax=Thiomicrorhabdus sp. ZW0627 TaxID=3039774 RepID=UPI0024368609|nr:ABC transporter substrate-binding protein [Thiomicrorhabdus sp. ZW0627]MDG6772712.1 ABC transporter substrate-binding protein [Thiomicrorhabdus sp. ZW0627]